MPPESSAPAEKDQAPPTLGPLRALGWLFVFGALAAGILLGVVAYRMLVPLPEPERIETVIERSPDVVVALTDLARLETTRLHIERVIDLRDRQTTLFGLSTAEDAILLVAAADVSAGVDLTQMSDGDVMIEPDLSRATIVLPPAQVFEARLDNDRTYVHRRETDTLARRSIHLETRARQEAERTIRASALEAGLLERAERNAIHTIEALVHSLGFDEVVVRFQGAGLPND